jgi:succinate dehydrogenase / fumarate reductase membrane anchor subunit
VIVEDYVHSGLKFALMITVRLACYALVVAGVIAVLKIALAAP